MPQIISINSTQSIKLAVVIIISLIIGFLGGLYIGETGRLSLFTGPSVSLTGQTGAQKTEVKKGSYEEGYQAALDFARKKLQGRGGLMSMPGSLQYLNNVKVKSISGSDIVVEFDASKLDIFQEGLVTKTVKIPDTVTITQQIPKSADELNKEREEYQKKLAEFQKKPATGATSEISVPPIMSPTLFTIKEIKISDLKEGDILNIRTNTDISKTDTFEASSVTLINLPVMPKIENLPATPEATAPTPLPKSTFDINPPEPEKLPADKTSPPSNQPTGEIQPTAPNTADATPKNTADNPL